MAVHVRVDTAPGAAQDQRGIGLTGFFTALSVAVILFLVQIGLFLYLRNIPHLNYIYKPRAQGSPLEAEQSEPRGARHRDNILKKRRHWDVHYFFRYLQTLLGRRENILEKRGHWDAYYFLRYLQTLLTLFAPILLVVLPILIPLNYVNGRGQDLDPSAEESSAGGTWQVMGLDTLSFRNVKSSNTKRYTAHLVCAVLVIVWFCCLSFIELNKWGRSQCDHAESMGEEVQTQHYLVQKFKEKQLVGQAREIELLLQERGAAMDKFESAAVVLAHYDTVIKALDKKIEGVKGEIEIKECEKLCSGLVEEETNIRGNTVTASRQCHDCSRLAQSWCNILWANVGIPWFEKVPRIIAISIALTVMIVLWALPVSLTAALSQLDNLTRNQQLRSFLQRHETLRTFAVSIAGVLPGVALALLLMVIPPTLERFSRMSGATRKSQQAAFVQRFYFVFLFIQMFLVVSIASFFTSSFTQFLHNLETLRSATGILNLLSQNLPTAANYFFSCMILQSLSGSANMLMQRTPLFWFIADKLFHYTPRQKWSRRDRMDIVAWGSVFPLYTTLACISLAYSIIAPLISLFAMISFGVFWLAHKYSMIHVRDLESDHGGILYPRAINQTFTGVYVMELCMAGLFFGVKDDMDRQTCVAHGFVMIAALAATGTFQIAMNVLLWKKLRARIKSVSRGSKLANLGHLGKLLERTTAWMPTTFEDITVRTDSTYLVNDADRGWEGVTDDSQRIQIRKLPNRQELAHVE